MQAYHQYGVGYKKGCTRLAAASDKVYQLLAQGRWSSPGTPASSTTKTGRHDIAVILLKVVLNTKVQIQSYPNPNPILGCNFIVTDTISYHNLYKILSGGDTLT